MIAMSAPASPAPTATPPNSAGPADPQAPAAGSADTGAESTPFAKVLGHQMKSAKQDDGKAEPTAKLALLLEQNDTAAAPPADALSIIASMLAGIAQPDDGKATIQRDKGVEVAAPTGDTEKDSAEGAADAAAPILATPVVAGTEPPVATTTDKKGEGSEPTTQAIDLPRDAKNPATPAIVAAGPTTKSETAAEAGASKADAGKFEALLDAAGQMQSASPNAASHTASGATPGAHANSTAGQTLPVATPVGARGWDHEVGEKLTWMAGRKETHAELVLNPPQLGRVEVSLSISGDQANATFVSASPVVREALENAIPHLRETLQSAGISLGQTQVGAESFQQAANQREKGDNSARGDSVAANVVGAAASGQTAPAQWLRRGNGLVDTFA